MSTLHTPSNTLTYLRSSLSLLTMSRAQKRNGGQSIWCISALGKISRSHGVAIVRTKTQHMENTRLLRFFILMWVTVGLKRKVYSRCDTTNKMGRKDRSWSLNRWFGENLSNFDALRGNLHQCMEKEINQRIIKAGWRIRDGQGRYHPLGSTEDHWEIVNARYIFSKHSSRTILYYTPHTYSTPFLDMAFLFSVALLSYAASPTSSLASYKLHMRLNSPSFLYLQRSHLAFLSFQSSSLVVCQLVKMAAVH